MSRSEGMCARLKVQVSSRHNGPAFIAVSTSSMAEKTVPISAAEVSIPGFAIRFNDMRLEIERRNCRPSIIDLKQGGRKSVARMRFDTMRVQRARNRCIASGELVGLAGVSDLRLSVCGRRSRSMVSDTSLRAVTREVQAREQLESCAIPQRHTGACPQSH